MATNSTLEHPNIPLPSIAYNMNLDTTHLTATQSSYDSFIPSNTLTSSGLQHSAVDIPSSSGADKVAFVPSKQPNEYMALPYDAKRFADLSELSGTNQTRFYSAKNTDSPKSTETQTLETSQKNNVSADADDYVFRFYIGSLSVVGLLILFRLIRKS
jgi:hypothetical protein